MSQSPLSKIASAESYSCQQIHQTAAALDGMADALALVGAGQAAALKVLAAAAARVESAVPAAAARLESGHNTYGAIVARVMASVASLVDYAGLVATSATGTAGLAGLMTSPPEPAHESYPAYIPVAEVACPDTVASVTGRGASERNAVETTIAPSGEGASAGAPVNRIADVESPSRNGSVGEAFFDDLRQQIAAVIGVDPSTLTVDVQDAAPAPKGNGKAPSKRRKSK